MKFEINEYNVVPKIEDRNTFYVKISESEIKYNKETILNKEKIDEIFKLLNEYKNDIIKYSEGKMSNYKGGRQQMMLIHYSENEIFHLIGNTPNQELSDFYSKLKNSIVNIIEK